MDRRRDDGGGHRGWPGDLGDLRRPRGSPRGVARRGHLALFPVAQRDGRRDARQRGAAGRLAGGPLGGHEQAAAEPRVQPAADVRVLRERAPANRRGPDPARAAACLPRHPRRLDRSSEPDADPGSHRTDAGARAPEQDPGGRAVHRPRQLQGHQRHAWPQRRRRAPAAVAARLAARYATPTLWGASAGTSSS